MPAPTEQIRVAIDQPRAYVQVIGRGSFASAPALREFGQAAIDAGCTEFFFDLGQCPAMDSTFTGVLAGLGLRLRSLDHSRMVLDQLNPHLAGILRTFGMDRLCLIIEANISATRATDGETDTPMTALETPSGNMQQSVRTMLEAHEDLVRLSSQNLLKFKDVLACLREDLARR